VGLIILTLLGLKYLPGWVKLVWLFQQEQQKREIEQLATYGQTEDDIWSRGNEKRIKQAHV
jgi:hypothetical protein